jgi:CDP-diacylglycerol--serine O-phosphatidyltransferase
MTTSKPKKYRLRDRPRVRTGLSILPSLFTIGNIFAGYYSIASTLAGDYDYAAVAIGVGAVLDVLDGRIARLTGTDSAFGVQLDSLADVVTFGIAPSVLALNWGVSSLVDLPAEIFQDVVKFGWLATFGFLVSGTLRLARFNVIAQRPSDKSVSKRHFVGLPIPAGAGLIAAIVHFHKLPVVQVGSALLWCILVTVLSFLMISTVRYPSFKDVDLKKPLSRAALLGGAMLIGLIALYSEVTLLVIATCYVGSGPVSRISQAVRNRMPDPVEPPAPHTGSHGDVS